MPFLFTAISRLNYTSAIRLAGGFSQLWKSEFFTVLRNERGAKTLTPFLCYTSIKMRVLIVNAPPGAQYTINVCRPQVNLCKHTK